MPPDKRGPKKLNILITNRGSVRGTGTEIVTRDLAFELKKLGYAPVVYSPVLGLLAGEVRAHGIPVFE